MLADTRWPCLQEFGSFYTRWEEGATDFQPIYWAPMPTSWIGVRPTPGIEDQGGVFLCVECMDCWVGARSHTITITALL